MMVEVLIFVEESMVTISQNTNYAVDFPAFEKIVGTLKMQGMSLILGEAPS